MRLLLSVFFTFVVALTFTETAVAQTAFGGLGGVSQIAIGLSPRYPEPNQEVTVSISNLVSSLYGSEITWLKDGVEIPETRNKTEFSVTVGALGEATTLSVTLNTATNGTQSARTVITPLYLDIVLEPQTHVPDFYPGRAEASAGSMVNATALLFGQNTLTNNLVYTWRVNDRVLGGGGQRAQSKVSFETPMDSRVVLSLEVSTLQGNVIARRTFLMLTTRPALEFYEVNTLYGVIERPLSSFFLVGNSATIRAVPFHLDSRVFNRPDVATWEVDSRDVSSGNNPYELTIQKTALAGSSNVNFQVQSTTALLQGAESNLRITY